MEGPPYYLDHPTRKLLSLAKFIPWFLACLFYFYEFVLQVSPGVISHQLVQAFALSPTEFGLLGGIYFLAYALMQLPVGILLDRYGPQRTVSLASLCCGLATIWFSQTDLFTHALWARFCIGLSSAFAMVGAMKFAANWFARSQFTLMTGLMVTIGTLGAVGGQAPLVWMTEALGWRLSLTLLGGVGIILAILLGRFAADAPNNGRQLTSTSHQQSPGLIASLANLRKWQLWLLAIIGGLLYAPTPVLTGMWGVPFFKLKFGLNTAEAANLVSMVLIGWIVGGPLWGIVTHQVSRLKPALLLGTGGALISLWMIITTSFDLSAMMASYWLFAFGLFSSSVVCAFTLAKTMYQQQQCATPIGFMAMLNTGGVAVCQPVIGWLLTHTSSGGRTTSLAATAALSVNDYSHALNILLMSLVVALALLVLVKPPPQLSQIQN